MTEELNQDSKIIDTFVKMKYEDYKDLCRLCMSKKTKMKSIFSTEGTVEKLHFCTGILVTREDCLPTMLCHMCISQLSLAYKFKTACLRSDDLFRKIFVQKSNLDNVKNEVDNSGCDYVVPKMEVEDHDDYNEADDKQYGDDNFDGDDNRDGDEMFAVDNEECQSKPQKSMLEEQNRTSASDSIMNLKNEDTHIDKRLHGLYCHLCNVEFNSKESLTEHKNVKHGGKWICEICGKQFRHRASHYSHMKSHLPPQYKCSDCDYRCWHKADMNKHIRIHTGNKLYVCEYCTFSFHNSSNLWGHIRRKHSGSYIKKYACSRCDLTFYTPDKLQRHVDTHDNIKRFECDVCHTAFSRRCYWKRHLLKQHSVVVPQIRPGRRKINAVREEKNLPLLVIDASVKAMKK